MRLLSVMTLLSSPPDGLKEGYRGGTGTKVAMTVIFSIALYNSLELIILILLTFRRYRGLYFWSIFLSTVLGVVPQAVGLILNFYNVAVKWVGITISTVGWYFMVPGQSFVLYSRLHLVLQDARLLRSILCLITVSTVVMIVPVTSLTYATVYVNSSAANTGFNVMERLQLTWFSVQEGFLSTLYIWETIRLLRLDPQKDNRRSQIKYELIAVNVSFIIMDIVLIVMEYTNWYIIQTTLKTAIYSIKLKLEFAVLSRLILYINVSQSGENSGDSYYPDFVDPSQFTSDVTHAPRVESNTLRPRRTLEDLSSFSLPFPTPVSGRSFDAPRRPGT